MCDLMSILPYLRAVATIFRATLERRTVEQSSLLERRDLAVFRIGIGGQVIGSNPQQNNCLQIFWARCVDA